LYKALENLWAKKKEFDSDKELKKDERFKQAFALEQERVANEKLNLELKKELELKAHEVELKNKEEEMIMTMDLSALPDDQKQYYICGWSKIMSREPSPQYRKILNSVTFHVSIKPCIVQHTFVGVRTMWFLSAYMCKCQNYVQKYI